MSLMIPRNLPSFETSSFIWHSITLVLVEYWFILVLLLTVVLNCCTASTVGWWCSTVDMRTVLVNTSSLPICIFRAAYVSCLTLLHSNPVSQCD